MEEIEIKKIISKTLVEQKIEVNSRIERKIFKSLIDSSHNETENIEIMLMDFVEPQKAKYICRYIMSLLNRRESLVNYLETLRKVRNSSDNSSKMSLEEDKINKNHKKDQKNSDINHIIDDKIIYQHNSSESLKKLQILQQKISKKLSSEQYNESLSITNEKLLDLSNNLISDNIKSKNFKLTDTIIKPHLTLSANKRMKTNQEMSKRNQIRDSFIKSSSSSSIVDSSHLDDRIDFSKPNFRPQKQINFFDNEKMVQDISIREKQKKLSDLNRRIAESASKTGIADAARISYLSSMSEKQHIKIPSIEWWDMAIIHESQIHLNLDKIQDLDLDQIKQLSTINGHVQEHEIFKPIRSNPATLNHTLTTKEARKLRRQNRQKKQKEEQEKIKLGIIDPPLPKVKMTNLMSVLTDNAIQDPTKMEFYVKEQSAKRLEKHLNQNEQRKLTKEQKNAKIRKKNSGNTTNGIFCCLFKLKRLYNPAWRFKIEKNANQLNLSGISALTKNISVVVVEGGEKQIRKYKKLMTKRIDFDDEKQQMINCKKYDDLKPVTHNCVLVWEGKVKNRFFKGFSQEVYQSEMAAREAFRVLAVEHYWDLSIAYDLNNSKISDKCL